LRILPQGCPKRSRAILTGVYNLVEKRMLPILPAILLLFLQGPAHLERLALEGRLPAGFDAEHLQAGREERAIAALLASGNANEFSSAILALLEFSEESTPSKPATKISTFVAITPSQVAKVARGYGEGVRSRDGPFAVV
jgi:hypothetical protein